MRAELTDARRLPTWPLTALFVGFPLYWLLGMGTLIWPIGAAVMAYFLWRGRAITVPRGFGVWLLFLVWVLLSASHLDDLRSVIGLSYRFSLYTACTIVFVYAYNIAPRVGYEYLFRILTWFFATIVAGGYLGLLFPTLAIPTPMSYIMPKGLLVNDMVQEMVVVRTTQFNPDAWAYIDPRPSAPFLYTNNWGNAYSLLAPVIVTRLFSLRGTRTFLPLLALVLASCIPAFLTLNRGMFVGLGIAAAVIAFRQILNGNFKVLVGMSVVAALAALAFTMLPVSERLDNRLDSSGTNDSRLTVYTETISNTVSSPWFGFGAPQPTESTVVPLGTQGQVWMVLFSHGFIGLALFMAWLAMLIVKTAKNRTTIGITWNSIFIVVFVQSFYYGLLVQGLVLVMLMAGFALQDGKFIGELRGRHRPSTSERLPSDPNTRKVQIQ